MANKGFFEPLPWPDGSLSAQCRALCQRTLHFKPSSRPSMQSVHTIVRSWESFREKATHTRSDVPEPVDWQCGLGEVKEFLQRDKRRASRRARPADANIFAVFDMFTFEVTHQS